jgi:serine protease
VKFVIQCTIESIIAGSNLHCLSRLLADTYDIYCSPQGTIIAQGGNNLGIVGVIPDNNNICLLIARAFGDADGGALGSSVSTALEWCGDNDARVINMSLGSGFYSRSQQAIIQDLQNKGVLVVAASGNDGNNDLNYPASYDESLSVGAVDEDLEWASFSQFNSQVDVCAPGVRIVSTIPTIAIFDNNNDAKYDALLMDGSALVPDILEGDLASCGLASETCEDVSGKICFVERGGSTFADKAINCEGGGGIGLIIYNNVGFSDIVMGTLGGITAGIPVLSMSRNAGRILSSASSLPSVTIDVRYAGYRPASGTSMAAPHATGVVARIWSVRPECTSAQVREAVENTALDLGDEGRDDKYGAGLVQMESAYEYLLSFDAPCGAVEAPTNPPTDAPTRKPSKAPTTAPTEMPTSDDIVFQTDASTGDEAVTVTDGSEDLTGNGAVIDGSEDPISAEDGTVSDNMAADTSSACNGLPSVGDVVIYIMMAILFTVV